MDYDILINALKAAEAQEKSGLPPVGILDASSHTRPWGQRQIGGNKVKTWTKYKETELTADHNRLYDCTGLFGLCGPDEVIGLSMTDDKLVEWMGWQSSWRGR